MKKLLLTILVLAIGTNYAAEQVKSKVHIKKEPAKTKLTYDQIQVKKQFKEAIEKLEKGLKTLEKENKYFKDITDYVTDAFENIDEAIEKEIYRLAKGKTKKPIDQKAMKEKQINILKQVIQKDLKPVLTELEGGKDLNSYMKSIDTAFSKLDDLIRLELINQTPPAKK
jgi:small-conductance mechanosensitive channel